MHPEDYNELTKFHGHSCPGLAIGYRAVKAAVGRTHFQRAGDEELVAVAGHPVQVRPEPGSQFARDHGFQYGGVAGRGRPFRVGRAGGLLAGGG